MINLWALPSQIPKCPPLYQFAFILRLTCKSPSFRKSAYLDLRSASSLTSLPIALEVALPVPLAPSGSINLRHLRCLIRFNGVSLIHSSQLLSLLIVVRAVVNFPRCLLCFVYRLSAFSFIHAEDNIFTDPRVYSPREGRGRVKITHSRVLALLPYSHSLAYSLMLSHACLCHLNLFNSIVHSLRHSHV